MYCKKYQTDYDLSTSIFGHLDHDEQNESSTELEYHVINATFLDNYLKWDIMTFLRQMYVNLCV